ncbi:hypothetical protein [Arthrobacter sp.]|uniref:hypothetical protein n=1 Tax=Arthrobacter sp. TaxID=1667 RepID=UPI00289AE866|nr:hypothetical protein [Arthrobacter sp.]
MSVPRPGEDLARRIVAGSASLPTAAEAKRPRSRGRYVVAFGSILTLVSGFVLAGAYVLGTMADEPLSSPQHAYLLAGWNQIAENPSEDLSREALQELRDSGWSCPELSELGFTLEGATTTQVAGQPAVALSLERNGEKIKLYEQRPVHGERTPDVLHAVSERPVAEEGFTLQTGNSATAPQVWQNASRPGEAVLSTGNVTYTIASSAPHGTVAGAVSELSLTESAQLLVPARDRDSGPVDRVMRGFSLLAGAGRSL